jgi:hypothetical protein
MALVVVGGLAFGVAGPACAATLVVGTTADSSTANPPHGNCSIPPCSLREAVTDANDEGLHPGPDTIQVPPGIYNLVTFDALPTITTDVTIEGTGGARVTTITGADTTGSTLPTAGVLGVAGGKLTVRGVTISGNRVAGTANTSGGAIAAEFGQVVIESSVLRGNRNDAVPASNGVAGGGLGANGTLVTISDSAIEENLWLGSSALNAAGGVVVANASGSGLTITRASVSRNRADPPSGTSTYATGGVQLLNGTALTISDSTVSQNSASRPSSSLFRSGGILTINSTPQPATPAITLTNVTLTDNSTAPGGSVAVGNAAFVGNPPGAEPRVVRNSIVAGGLPVNCGTFGEGVITSSGGNLEDANTCNFTGPGDLFNTGPRLAALQFNGGLGLSQEPLANSAALGRARPGFCSATDQTGLGRPQGGGCDSGAVETAAPPVNTALPSISGTAAGGQTLTCNPGTFTENPTLTFAWLSDGAVVGSGSTFAVGDAQLDTAVQCRVTATNLKGSTVATSAAVVPPKPPVVTATPPVNTARPRFSGTLRTGQRLTCSEGTFTGAASFALAWLRNGTPISAATAATYTLTATDAGKAIQCRVTATGPGGTVVAESAPKVPAKACIVPALVGKTRAAARKALTRANCALGKTKTRKSSRKPRTVLASSPPKGRNLPAGTKVTLTLARK